MPAPRPVLLNDPRQLVVGIDPSASSDRTKVRHARRVRDQGANLRGPHSSSLTYHLLRNRTRIRTKISRAQLQSPAAIGASIRRQRSTVGHRSTATRRAVESWCNWCAGPVAGDARQATARTARASGDRRICAAGRRTGGRPAVTLGISDQYDLPALPIAAATRGSTCPSR